jgi:hypothetical protein
MISALKDIIVLVSTIVALAYSTGQQKWLWQQIAVVRREAIAKSTSDWGCPSIFDKSACRTDPVDIRK